MLARTIALFVISASLVNAENWPGWRGPRGDGTSFEKNLPTIWSATNNIAWKVQVPGSGHSSPIVWGRRIFLTTALVESEERCLVCFDRDNGRLSWQQTVIKAPLEAKNGENSFASSTPCTDGESVFATFLDGKDVVAASYDFAGRQLWLARPGQFLSQHGFSHNPTIFKDFVILVCYSKAENFVAAISRRDGRTLWKTQAQNATQSYSPPLICEVAGKFQMIVPGNNAVTSYDPETGKVLWFVEGPSDDSVVAPVFNQKAGLVLTSSSWPKRVLLGIRPDGSGNVTASHVVWNSALGAPYVPSPASYGDWFFSSGFETKEAFCFEAATGKILWREKMGLHHASPVVAGGLLYFLNDEGVTHVVKAGPEYKLIARNELGEKTFASPAISEGRIFIRAFKQLYCIGPAF